MLKAVIFDLNGVFIKSPRLTDRLHEEFGVPEAEALEALKIVMNKVRLPNAEDVYSLWQPYLKKWNIPLSHDEFLTYWFSAEKELQEMFDLARSLRSRGLKVFILSNNFSERTAYYNEHFPELHEVTDKMYFSWQTGYTKNHPEAYTLLLTEQNLKPEECIFFDDSESNVTIASSLGIHAHVFESPLDCEAKITAATK
jgi:HAD superfamily hydrolase (TIGR01509 family)